MGRKGKETTMDERKIVLLLHNEGKTYSDIAHVVGRSRKTIFSIIQNFKQNKTLVNRARKGRPIKLNSREKRHIITAVTKDPRITASEITAHLREDLGKDIHVRTISRALNTAGYHSRVPRRKPYASTINQKKCLQFAEE